MRLGRFVCHSVCLSVYMSVTPCRRLLQKQSTDFIETWCYDWAHQSQELGGVTPTGRGWTNARGLRGLGGPKPGPKFFLYILIFQVLGVSHLFYSTANFFVNVHFAFHHCFVFNGNFS